MQIRDELRSFYLEIDNNNIYSSNSHHYWSNLNKEENKHLISTLQHMSTSNAIKKYHRWLFDVIFSKKRAVGLELLGLNGEEACIDCGCMWGALTIPLAKRCSYVLGVDHTLDSLKFLRARAKEEKLDNIDLLHEDLKRIKLFDHKFDVAILNGVLEWIPDSHDIELKKYYAQKTASSSLTVKNAFPRQQQKDFLSRLKKMLKPSGKLYLSIENRYDYKMFIGFPDPHAGLAFLSILPRSLAHRLSFRRVNRPYVNWTYSFKGLKALVIESGFSKVHLYGCYPDYRFPERIVPYEHLPGHFESLLVPTKLTMRLRRKIEVHLFRTLKCRQLYPSIIAIAEK